ncbi:hypothetical protein SHELI_v1c10810 [Spiroplasma helicoides]|uniref:GIY-YIG domain-containing protein n=1 Tax=Spiroplasma helicoides TaxID=216938 RepID=A0A1B3SM71_9MOLU|nr:GIY-YIG nuclease family protein [Spiroplasma helicoides]AOG61028.1 hypothetical protein SHELI_v1c10810 [Spiroplasma helicoides]
MQDDFYKKYLWVKKIKSSKEELYKATSQQYCNSIINDIITRYDNQIFNVSNLNNYEDNVSGVYLIFSLDNKDNLKFSYIGESTNIKKRWKTHINNYKAKNKQSRKIRSKENNIENIRFVTLAKINEQNQRLKKETYYIYLFKSKFTNLNTKLANMKMRCDNGHGVKRTYLSYVKNSKTFKLFVYGVCKNKLCNNKFQIY